jgi:hypothetical protein
VPGIRGAEGQEKGKGIIVRWGLEEAQSKSAGRRTGTGFEVWYIRDERARGREALHPHGGVLYESGVYARNDPCFTLGDLPVLREDRVAGNRHRPAGRSQQRAK